LGLVYTSTLPSGQPDSKKAIAHNPEVVEIEAAPEGRHAADIKRSMGRCERELQGQKATAKEPKKEAAK
jgi:hypothetical protein